MSRAAIYGSLLHKHRIKKRKLIAGWAFLTALIVVSTTILQTYFTLKPPNYTLDPKYKSLVGDSRDDTAKYLTKNKQGTAFDFALPQTLGSSTAGGDSSEHTGRNDNAYSASLSIYAREGISVTDTASKIAVTLTPEFYTGEGKRVDGDHLVYPVGSKKLVYTLKYNGLKEDIIIPEFQGEQLSFKFKLKLPSGVEARLDDQGNIGIYSSDPTLFGNISFGSDEDRAKVDKARENGQKTHLVMTIPAPIVKDATGKEHTNKSTFKLSDKQTKQSKETPKGLPADAPKSLTTQNTYDLTLESKNLKDLAYPIAIDPTISVTSAGDFNGTTLEGGAELDSTNNLIKRSSLTGGTVGAWNVNAAGSNLPNYTQYRYNTIACTYAGRVFATALDATNSVSFPITNGVAGTVNTTAGTSPSLGASAVDNNAHGACHNGYMYVVGGYEQQGFPFTIFTTVQYAKLNADGTFGAWVVSSNPLLTAVMGGDVAILNGYIYVTGGCTSASAIGCGSDTATTQYAKIQADGSLASFANATATFTDGNLHYASATSYNGFLYVSGGYRYAVGDQTEIYMAKPDANGNITAWQAAGTMTARASHELLVVAGYAYLSGSSGSSTTIEYAPILADGTVGTWRTTTALTTGLAWHAMVADKNYLMTLGGSSSGIANPTLSTTIQSTRIKSAGELHDGTWSVGTSVVNPGYSYSRAAAVYNGYMYFSGGIKVSGTALTEVQYVPINANGSLGTWATTTSMGVGRDGHSLTAYDGYLYATGGCTGGIVGVGCTGFTNTTEYAPINANGTVGTWTAGAAMVAIHAVHTSTAYNGYLYVSAGINGDTTEYSLINTTTHAPGAWANTTHIAGGSYIMMTAHNGYMYTASSTTGTVQVAPINSNGTIGTYNDANAANMQVGHGGVGVMLVVVKGYLYVAGTGASNNVEFAPISSNGNVGSWAYTKDQSAQGDTQARGTDGNALYTINEDGTTQYQFINNGGSGGVSWADSGQNFTTGRYHHASVIYNDYLYVIGGCISSITCTTTTNTIRYSLISSTGTLGAWATTTTNLPANNAGFSAVAYTGRMYIFGGDGGNISLTYSIPIDSNGNITTASWTAGTNLPNGAAFGGMVLNAGRFYLTGGSDASTVLRNEVYYTDIVNTVTGALGSWNATTPFTTARYAHNSVAYGGYLYVIGGCSNTNSGCGSPNGSLADTQVAPINSNGTVGAWQTTSSLPFARFTSGAIAYNGYLYVSGGWNPDINDTYTNTVYAPILAGGLLGPWTKSANAMTNSRYGVVMTGNKGKAYMTGGWAGGLNNPTTTTDVSALQSIPRTGTFSKLYDLDVGVRPTKLITRGTKRNGSTNALSYMNTNNMGTSFGSSTSASDIGNALSLALGTNVSLSRYFFLRYTIDDTYSAVFPDSGNESTITDFDLYYTSNPGRRLRNGRTFTTGNDGKPADRGLQASPQ